MSFVDQASLVQTHERFAHRPRQLRRQCVRRPIPIRGRADRAQLLEDDATLFLDERLRTADKRVPADIETSFPLLGNEPLDDVLRRDARVVRARHPQRLGTPHPRPANENILNCIGQAMTDVQDASHVRRRHHDRERHTIAADARRARRVGGKTLSPEPLRVHRRLGYGRVVSIG